MLMDNDAWIGLYGAKRILDGQVLYRDFFDFVTPGTDYFWASVFYLFGVKLSVARIAISISNAVAISIVVFISYRVIKNKLLAAFPPIFFAIYAGYNYYVSHHWLILVPVILVLFSGITNIKEQSTKPHKWFFAGLATAGAFLFIQSIGLTLFGMLVLFIIWYYTVDKLRIKSIIHPLSYYALGFTIPLAIVVICFALSGSLSAFIYDSFIWPFTNYRVINVSSFFSFIGFLIKGLTREGLSPAIIRGMTGYLAIMLSFVIFMHAVSRYKQRKETSFSLPVFIAFLCIGILLGLVQNPTINHIMVFLPIYLILIILIFEYKHFRSDNKFRKLLYLYFPFMMLVLLYNAYRNYSLIGEVMKDSAIVRTHVGEVRMLKEYPGMSYLSNPYVLLKAMDGQLPKDIFVLYWSPDIYLLTGTNNPTPLNIYIPYYNTEKQALSVIRALKANHTKIVIIDGTMETLKHIGLWFVDKRIFSQDEPVISYINSHYKLMKAIEGYKIYVLKD